MQWFQILSKRLLRYQQAGLRRHRRVVQRCDAVLIQIDGRCLISFGHNDYLGLSQHIQPELDSTSWQGAGASNLVGGFSDAQAHLEQDLLAFLQQPAGLIFPTGYMANLAVLPALVQRGDVIFSDRLNHASWIDSARLSQAELKRYRHLDCAHLEALLRLPRRGRALIVTESIFSMDGDEAPLLFLMQLAEKYQALLVIDDAHGFGVQGEKGRGVASILDPVRHTYVVITGGFGKAMGLSGGFVVASSLVIEALLQAARTYTYTTGLLPLQAQCLRHGLQCLELAQPQRLQLQQNIAAFRQEMSRLSVFALADSKTAIQPVGVGALDINQALEVAQSMESHGVFLPLIRPPTVPLHSQRFRVSLSAAHLPSHIHQLCSAFRHYERSMH